MSDLTDRLRCFDRQTCTEAAERIETLEAELAAMRAGGEPVAQISGIDEYGPMLGWFKHWTDVAIGTHLYTHPQPAAQDAERKLLTDEQAPAQAAPAYKDSTPELHIGDSAFESWYSTYSPAHKSDKQRARDAYTAGMGDPLVVAAPTPQADSQPAPTVGDPPREDFAWLIVQEACETEPADEDDPECVRILRLDLKSAVLAAFLRHDAARAQADSVLEDAARYRWIRGPVEESTRYSRWRIEYWDGPNGWQPMQRESMDNAIDAARKQGANHD